MLTLIIISSISLKLYIASKTLSLLCHASYQTGGKFKMADSDSSSSGSTSVSSCDEVLGLEPFSYEPVKTGEASEGDDVSETGSLAEEEGAVAMDTSTAVRVGVTDWCTCHCCQPMSTEGECTCCQELELCCDKMEEEGNILKEK